MITITLNDRKYVKNGSSFEVIKAHTSPDIRPEFALNSFISTTVYNNPDDADVFTGTMIDLDKLISVVNTINPQSAYATDTDSIVVERREHSAIATDDYVDLSNDGVPIWYEKGNVYPLDPVQLLRLVGRFIGDQVLLSKNRLMNVSQRAIDNFNHLDQALVSFACGIERAAILAARDSKIVRLSPDGQLIHAAQELIINFQDSIGLTTPFMTGVEIAHDDCLFMLRDKLLKKVSDGSGLLLKTSDGGFTQLKQEVIITSTGPTLPMGRGRTHPVNEWRVDSSHVLPLTDRDGNKLILIPRSLCDKTVLLIKK